MEEPIVESVRLRKRCDKHEVVCGVDLMLAISAGGFFRAIIFPRVRLPGRTRAAAMLRVGRRLVA
ncbi:MAG: hypothetical protein IT293_08200 [Deltaproteobacteria bacterium]|nr:hypothetical protein [Deltaproteobacteria bacterium]